MKTICHIITGLDDGGAEAVLHRLCRSDRQNRHIVVSMMDAGKYGALLVADGAELHCLGARRGKISLKQIWQLCRLIRGIKPDLVLTWMYHANLIGGLAALFSGVKRIVWSLQHVHLTRHDSKFSTRMIDRISAFLSRWIPERIVAVGHKVADAHIARGYSDKFVVIHNGCDTDAFSPNAQAKRKLIEELQLKPDLPILGCVARWTPEKDHGNFLKAIALANRERPLQAILVGTGCVKDNDALGELIRKTGTTDLVTLVGSRDDIPDLMNLLDIHILPSKNEAFGNVLIEAMACGTPCISTNVGEAAHIVGDTGWIVEPKNGSAMSEAIVEALTEWSVTDKWKKRQTAARSRVVENFSAVKMMSDYQMVWHGKPC